LLKIRKGGYHYVANKVNLQKIKSEIETKQAELEKYEKR